MRNLIARRLALVCASVAVIAGATLLMSLALGMEKRGFDRAGLTSANTAAASATLGAPLTGLDFSLCHTPASISATTAVIRLAATRTEVPQTEMKAATPAPDFADIDPPLWDRLGSVSYK